MNSILCAPQICDYIARLSHVRYHDAGNTFTYDNRTYTLLDEMFSLLKHLEPVSETGVWELWLTAERGSIEAYGNYEELLDDGAVDIYTEFEENWRSQFPDERKWFHFAAVDDEKIGYRAVFLDHRQIIEVDPRKERGFEYDIAEFAQWQLDAVKTCINEIRSGGYSERVERELPPQYRTGTIRRKDFWDIFPQQRKDFFRNITAEELQEFLVFAKAPGADLSTVKERLPAMTANDFYGYCAMGYQVNHYTGTELTPKEQYYLHADGRDDGLGEINPNSAEAFVAWFLDKGHWGGHPWEICRGGNSTHIDLFVILDERGYYLKVAGSAWSRTVEAVKIYLALKRAGLPVCLYQADLLVNRLTEEEEIGVVPEGVIPAYCHSLFPGKKVIDFMNLPCEKRERVAKLCCWQPLKPIMLKKQSF